MHLVPTPSPNSRVAAECDKTTKGARTVVQAAGWKVVAALPGIIGAII